MIHENQIEFEKRVILKDNVALNLVSFYLHDPQETDTWMRLGDSPVMFCEKTWDELSKYKFKINSCPKGTVESIEIND